SGDGGHGDTGAGGESFEKHVAGTGEGAVPAGRGVESGFDKGFAGLDAAGDSLPYFSFGFERDDGGVGVGLVLVFERRLRGAEFVSGHGFSVVGLDARRG